MDIFDDISKSFNNTKNKLTNKTGDFLAISDYESSQRNLRKEIENKFNELGKTVYKKEKEIEGSSYISFISEINEKKIEELDKKINEIKSRQRCKICGYALTDGTVFCPNCGNKILTEKGEPVNNDTNRFCNQCGISLDKDSIFCPNCGNKIIQ